jgi:SPP1 family predicted phage head-tail adaptor
MGETTLALKAGLLDRRITIRRMTLTTNEFNEPVEGFSDLADVWASKNDIPDGERWRSQQVQATVTTRFQVRWNEITETITPRDQLVCDGVRYEIVSIKELGRKQGIEITAAARTDDDTVHVIAASAGASAGAGD